MILEVNDNPKSKIVNPCSLISIIDFKDKL